MSTDILTTKDSLIEDIVRETGVSKDEIEKLAKEVKLKNPGMRVHAVSIPYAGLFFLRPQLLKDVKESTKLVNTFVDSKISEYGGTETIEASPDKMKISRDIDLEATDLSNECTLKNCVLYPYDFREKLERGEIETGVIPSLLESILEISSWGNITITEI